MACSPTLYEGVRRPGREAFAAIFDEYHLGVCRYLCSLVDDAALAEDLAQQAFVKAYRALTAGRAPENVRAWLFTIATRTALSALRRRRVVAWLPLAPHRAAPGAGGREEEGRLANRELLHQALRALPEPDAACLLLRFQQGLSYDELARVLHTTVPAAKMRLSRARAAFREAYLQLSQEVNR